MVNAAAPGEVSSQEASTVAEAPAAAGSATLPGRQVRGCQPSPSAATCAVCTSQLRIIGGSVTDTRVVCMQMRSKFNERQRTSYCRVSGAPLPPGPRSSRQHSVTGCPTLRTSNTAFTPVSFCMLRLEMVAG